mgnify:CR=1 FL=1
MRAAFESHAWYVSVSAAAAASMAMVAQQYEVRQRGAPKVKVLLMDGGTWDPIVAQMLGASVPDAIDESLTTFQQFLSKVAADATVEHIVYVLVPELPNIPGVAEMRPPLRQACADSAVPCHFIDLQEVWEQGDPAQFTASNGYLPSAEGGVAIGLFTGVALHSLGSLRELQWEGAAPLGMVNATVLD